MVTPLPLLPNTCFKPPEYIIHVSFSEHRKVYTIDVRQQDLLRVLG